MGGIKRNTVPSSLIVTQSNRLVEARYNLPLGEQRLILTMISRIQPDDEDFKEYRINVREFTEFLGIDKNSAYREFDKITTTIMTRVLIFEEFDGPLKVGWVSSAKYLRQEGAVLLCFDPKLKPYLLQLKGNFTCSRLDMLLNFKSQYTMRIYNLLKQYEGLGERQIEVDFLREILGLRENQYKRYNDFKKDILLSTQKELAKKSDIYFEFDEIKYGRRVGAIHFRIFIKQPIESTSTNVLTDLVHIALDSPSPDAQKSPLLAQLLLLIPMQHPDYLLLK